jgi:hypothetical protein
MELLNIDLNEIASQAISEKMQLLESHIESLENTNHSQLKRITELEKETCGYQNVLSLLNTIRDTYASIKQSEADKGGWYDSKAKNQYKFISEVLNMFYGVKQEHSGWYCSRSDGNLRTHLAINYYNSKESVCDLFRILAEDNAGDINFITTFKMPYDWERERIMSYAKEPKYNTNSCIFGIGQYWVEYGAGESNAPHDLIMRSPFILEDEIFGTLLSTIKNQRDNYKYLFALPIHNKSINKSQIQQMGRCLLKIEPRAWDDTIKDFIKKFIKEFCTDTLDYLKQFATCDNQFRILHWKNFPANYQALFLKEMPFVEALKAVNDYSCDLQPEEKESLLREILTVS